MKFSCTVEINQAIEKVHEVFMDHEKKKFWQDGYQGMESLSGTPGTVGSVNQLKYRTGSRTMILIETVLINDPPMVYMGNYDTASMENTMKNTFEKVADDRTIWTAEIEYTKFRGLLPKLLPLIMPSMFRKQVQNWLDKFKDYIEENQ